MTVGNGGASSTGATGSTAAKGDADPPSGETETGASGAFVHLKGALALLFSLQIQELEVKQKALLEMKNRAEKQLEEAEAKVKTRETSQSFQICRFLDCLDNDRVFLTFRVWRSRNLLKQLKPRLVSPNLM